LKKDNSILTKRVEEIELEKFEAEKQFLSNLAKAEIEEQTKFNALTAKFDEFRDLKNQDLQNWFNDFNLKYEQEKNRVEQEKSGMKNSEA
jgi:hypothetical protein